MTTAQAVGATSSAAQDGQPSIATLADSKCVSRRNENRVNAKRSAHPKTGTASPQEAFEVLEPDDGKLSRPVLRGLDPSNGVRLLDPRRPCLRTTTCNSW